MDFLFLDHPAPGKSAAVFICFKPLDNTWKVVLNKFNIRYLICFEQFDVYIVVNGLFLNYSQLNKMQTDTIKENIKTHNMYFETCSECTHIE